ncbi:MAG: phosphatase PAP2 family protein [Hyphomicrobiales bacterium]|nr:phosphatase PAP2 family protein [Hyphomicrobiales bacterium]
MRLYDVLSAVFLICLILGFIFFGKQGDIGKRFTAALFLSLYVVFVAFARRESGILEYSRDSPSMVILDFHDLRTLFPVMNPKVTSGNSFPGDHGITSVLFIILFWYFAGWRAGMISLLQIPLFVVPRLIGGGHWFTDAVVGGIAFGMMAASWALLTPFAGFCCRALLKPVRRGQELLARRKPV